MPQTRSNALLNRNARSDWVRLRTLMSIRWIAVVGQFVAVLVAIRFLDLDLRLDLALMCILALVGMNLATQMIAPENQRLTERYTLASLVFDMLQLAFLLFATGGLTNPFAVLLIAPVVVAATTLTLASTLLVCGLAVLLASVLAFFYLPLQFHSGQVLALPQIYLIGIWVALCVCAIFATLYVRRVTVESFSMSQALLATQMALDREQRLTSLGGVIAAAAHELGTPLATIKLTASELRDEAQDYDLPAHFLEDICLITQQAERCREIMRSMGRAGKEDHHLKTAPVTALVEEAAAPHQDRGKAVHIRLNGGEETKVEQPDMRRDPEVLHGLRNLVQNAVDFAQSNVWIDIRWTADHLYIVVGDDGAGYPSDLMGRIGDPFVRKRRDRPEKTARPGYEGMGLGLFIAKTLLERSGAQLTFANAVKGVRDTAQKGPTGALVEVVWPRREILVEKEVSRAALGENSPVS